MMEKKSSEHNEKLNDHEFQNNLMEEFTQDLLPLLMKYKEKNGNLLYIAKTLMYQSIAIGWYMKSSEMTKEQILGFLFLSATKMFTSLHEEYVRDHIKKHFEEFEKEKHNGE